MDLGRGRALISLRWLPILALAGFVLACDGNADTDTDDGMEAEVEAGDVAEAGLELATDPSVAVETGEDGAATDPGGDSGANIDRGVPDDVPLDEACAPDCTGRCGVVTCQKDCGLCPEGQYCQGNDCLPCPEPCMGHCRPHSPECSIIFDYPNCEGRTCGPDGIGGTCAPGCPDGEVCDESRGTCVLESACPWVDPSWGPAGAATSLRTPAEQATIQATCFDFTADGLGDNGLKGLAAQINDPLATVVENASPAILVELVGVTDLADTPSFQLNVLMGPSATTPPAASGDFWVQADSYDADTCRPLISFNGARIEGGKLTTPPSQFRLSFPVEEGLVLDVTLIQAQVKGDIQAGGDVNGFELENGVLAGVVTKQELNEAVGKLQAACDAAPPDAKPDFCTYLGMSFMAMSLIFDLHQVGDGTFIPKSKEAPGDATSICLTFSLAKARIVGFEPVPER